MDIRIEPRADHLRVVVEGEFSLQQARDGFASVIARAVAAGHTRILVDGRAVPTQVSIAERYELATLLAKLGQGKVRMAIVMARHHMFTKTFEDTALNRGVPMRTTDSMVEAMEFLGIAPEP